MKPVLLILAAGMGRRYGGLKQLDAVGPNGETIIDYSIYDALAAGFKRIIFVIRQDFKNAFKKRVGDRFKNSVEIDYAYQEMDLCLPGFPYDQGREKPWGTGHAVLAAKSIINEPFTVINADDYYGPEAYRLILEHISAETTESGTGYAMVGYILENTLSNYGFVSRGVCEFDEEMYLQRVVERTKINKVEGKIFFTDENGIPCPLSGNEIVSMNFWGLQPEILAEFEIQFHSFLSSHGRHPAKEFFLPSVIDRLVQEGRIRLKILPTRNAWLGVTYPKDRHHVAKMILGLVKKGIYPQKVF